MAMLLKGAEVAKALTEELHAKTDDLKKNGVEPCLAILRVGAREDDLAYERGALKRCEKVGVAVRQVVLPEDVTQDKLMENIHALNADEKVHGVLMFRPLPKHLKADQNEICNRLDPKKDVDCMTHMSNAGVFEGLDLGYAPCTPAACMEILDYYGIDCKGKNAVVIGRSLVVGKPAAMMLMGKNATVTVCHTKTVNTAEICKGADIIVSAAGAASDQQSQQEQQDQCQHHAAADGDNSAYLTQQGQFDVQRDLEHGNLRLGFGLRLRLRLREGDIRHRAGILRHPKDVDGVLLLGDPVLGGAGDGQQVVALFQGRIRLGNAQGFAVLGSGGKGDFGGLIGDIHGVFRDFRGKGRGQLPRGGGQLRQGRVAA